MGCSASAGHTKEKQQPLPEEPDAGEPPRTPVAPAAGQPAIAGGTSSRGVSTRSLRSDGVIDQKREVYGGVPALCSKSCGRHAFGKFESCCARCSGPDGRHSEDCETKGLCDEGCGRRAFIGPQGKLFKTCCKSCSYLHKEKGFFGHDISCEVRDNDGMSPPWYWKSIKNWPEDFHEEVGGDYVKNMATKLLQKSMPDREILKCMRVEDSKLWKDYTEKRLEIRERLCGTKKDEWQKFDGYISKGDDLLTEIMTIEEAKCRAVALPDCKGFCFRGDETCGEREVFFKTKWDITVGASKWTSYRRKEEIKPETSELIEYSAGTTLDHFVNEVWVFHGTSEDAAKGIAKSNFRLPDKAGCFGKGAYFAEAALKSDGYAKKIEEGEYALSNAKVMMLCRVTLGSVYHIEHGTDRSAERLVVDPNFDSVVGVAHTFREFLVYDVRQIYPEYIFVYAQVS